MVVFPIPAQVTPLDTCGIKLKPSLQYLEHETISINGNSDFRTVATSNDWQGDGSLSFPYVISEYNITSDSDGSLIEIKNTNLSFQIINCLINGKGGENRGIYFRNVTNGQIINNTITKNQGYGIHLELSNKTSIIGNKINATKFWGLELENSYQNNISSNEISKTDYGIKLHSSENNTLLGNIVTKTKRSDDFYGGIFVWASNHNTLSSNNISNTPLDGVKIHFSSNCKLSGNFIYNNSRRGIVLEDSSNNSLSHNIINNSQLDGLYSQNSQSNTLIGNSLFKNHNHGIYLLDSDKCTLNENTISENQGDGIKLNRSHICTLFDNNVTDNFRGISDFSTKNNVFTGNFLFLNRDYGLFLDGSEDAVIEWNNFIDNYLTGNGSQAFDVGGINTFRHNYWSDGIVDNAYKIDSYVSISSFDDDPLTDYVPQHQLSVPVIISPTKGNIVSKEVNIRWGTVRDSRTSHEITYSLYYSTDGDEWILIVSTLTTTHFVWNTTTLEDGPNYRIKINASCLFGVSSEAISEVFIIDNEYFQPTPPPELILLLITGIIITIGLFLWKGKSLWFQPKLELPSFVICLGSLTDEGLTIQEKSEECPFDDQELLSMIEYSAVLYQHGEIGSIYGPFPKTSITRSTDMEWHYLSFAFHVKDESAEDIRVVKKGGVTRAILLVFYEKAFDATISSQKDKIRDYLRSVDLEDISKGTKDWLTQIIEGVQEKVSTKE
jgi:parallel beta-helix repeat protein